MKRILLTGLIALSLIGIQAQERIMVITDPHVLAPSLVEPGSAFDEMMTGQRKMIDLSASVWQALIDTAMLYKPELVLIPGDLTKDGELESHTLVAGSLQKLREAGINVLVIPGNHDIGGKAYSYIGDETFPTETLANENWESTYPWVYEQAIAKDEDSHSYAAEPFAGVTMLAIDGAKNDAGVGNLSDKTLAFVLAQADSAVAKGNMIVAMAHWQILEHFDQQGTLESACRFKNADDLRDSLMAHGVHLVLTGHFHVNGITTYRTPGAEKVDSLVEITTGSPITYPCPYRWLMLSENRADVQVETAFVESLPEQDNMHQYSREWMSEHATNMIPQLSLRAWHKIENNMDLVAEMFGDNIAAMLQECIPATDSAKIAMVQKHFGSTVVELYLLHSDGNEPEYPEGDSLAQALYDGMESMMHEMTDAKMDNMIYRNVQKLLIAAAKDLAQEPVQSLVEDKTQWKQKEDADRTDDLHLTLTVNKPRGDQAIENTGSPEVSTYKFIQEGKLYIRRGEQLFDSYGRQVR